MLATQMAGLETSTYMQLTGNVLKTLAHMFWQGYLIVMNKCCSSNVNRKLVQSYLVSKKCQNISTKTYSYIIHGRSKHILVGCWMNFFREHERNGIFPVRSHNQDKQTLQKKSESF